MILTESQLDRINRIRTTSGRNAVTMQTAQLMMDVMSEDERRAILLRISDPAIEDVIGNVDKAVRFVRAAVATERERCAKIAEQEYRQEALDAPGIRTANVSIAHIAAMIRAGGKP